MASYNLLGIGTYRLQDEICTDIITQGLNLGYRQIDTAQLYRNHKDIALGIEKSNVPREEIFIISKILNSNIKKLKIPESVDLIKKELSIDYIDLILLHNPVKNYEKAWENLIQSQIHQNIRYIGTSNFDLIHLDKIIGATDINPYLNQIELSIWNQPTTRIIEYHKNANIIIQAHSIYTNNVKTNDLEFEEFSNNLGINKYKLMHKYLSVQQIPIVIGTKNITNLKSNYDWAFESFVDIDNNIIKKFDCNYQIYCKCKKIS